MKANHNRPRVLFVIPNVPLPIVSGGHMRDAQILHSLNGNGINPHILYFGAGENYSLDTNCQWKHRAAEIVFAGERREHPDRSRFATARRKLEYATSRIPSSHPFAYQYDAMGACDRILKCARRANVDVIVLRSFWCHYVRKLRDAGFKVIANCPDYGPLLASEMVRSVEKPLQKLGPLCNYFGVRNLEEHFLPQCDEVWAPTEREADALAGLVPRDRILILPNLVDVVGYPDLSTEPSSDSTLLFVANYSYLPNANAARLLLDTIFPAIRKAVPEASLLLVGKGLPPELVERAQRSPEVEALGFVEDLMPVYRRARVVLLPVREGAGMLFKAIEALAVGKPAVGFKYAFRGITHDKGAYIAVDSPAEVAELTIELLRNPDRCRGLATSARKLAQENLSWDVSIRLLARSVVLNRSEYLAAAPGLKAFAFI